MKEKENREREKKIRNICDDSHGIEAFLRKVPNVNVGNRLEQYFASSLNFQISQDIIQIFAQSFLVSLLDVICTMTNVKYAT